MFTDNRSARTSNDQNLARKTIEGWAGISTVDLNPNAT
jgi:hypothetical protein